MRASWTGKHSGASVTWKSCGRIAGTSNVDRPPPSYRAVDDRDWATGRRGMAGSRRGRPSGRSGVAVVVRGRVACGAMSTADRFKPDAPDAHAAIRLEEALPADHPHALLGVRAGGHLHGVRSARQLARLARQEATVVDLAGGGAPHDRTLARFRRDNAAAFTAVFQETVVLALRLGLAQLGHVALDGTKLRADTSTHTARSDGRMRQREAQLVAEIARLVEQAAAQDDAEDQESGADSDGYAVDEELALRAARLAKIRALRERLEAEQRAARGLGPDEAPVIAEAERRSFADAD